MSLPVRTPISQVLNQLGQTSQQKFWQRLSFPEFVSGALGGVLGLLPSASIVFLLYKFYMTYIRVSGIAWTLGILGTLPTAALMTVLIVPKFANFLKIHDRNYDSLLEKGLVSTCIHFFKLISYSIISFFATFADSYITYTQYTELMGPGYWPLLFALSDFISTLVARYVLLEHAVKLLSEMALKIQSIRDKLPKIELQRNKQLNEIDNRIHAIAYWNDSKIISLRTDGEGQYKELMNMSVEGKDSFSWFSLSTMLGVLGCGLGLYAATYYIPLAFDANKALCLALDIHDNENGYTKFATAFTYITAACLYSMSTAETFSSVGKVLGSSYLFLRRRGNDASLKKETSTSKMDLVEQEEQSVRMSLNDVRVPTIEIEEKSPSARNFLIKGISYHSILIMLSLISTATRGQLIREYVKDEADDKIALMTVAMVCGFVMRYWSLHLFWKTLTANLRQDKKTSLSFFLYLVRNLVNNASSETLNLLNPNRDMNERVSSEISIEVSGNDNNENDIEIEISRASSIDLSPSFMRA